MTTLICGDTIAAHTYIVDESVDVIIDDPPYNIAKKASRLPSYDKSDSIIAQKWTDFHAAWDARSAHEMEDFTDAWVAAHMCKLKPTGSMFVFGSHHNLGVTDAALKRHGWVIQWISWCIPNAFPNREQQQMTSANQGIIWARKSKKTLHHYNVERAKDYMVLDYWRQKGHAPEMRTNLRDFWPINNDARIVRQLPYLRHSAKKPPEIIARCIDIALPEEGGVVFDGFVGSGTTLDVCRRINHWIVAPRPPVFIHGIGLDLHAEYIRMCELRLLAAQTHWTPSASCLGDTDRDALKKLLGYERSYIIDNDPAGEDAMINIACQIKPRPGLLVPKGFERGRSASPAV